MQKHFIKIGAKIIGKKSGKLFFHTFQNIAHIFFYQKPNLATFEWGGGYEGSPCR